MADSENTPPGFPLAARALRLHAFANRSFDGALRLIVATASSILPGTGAVPEAMAIARDRDLKQHLILFDVRLSALEDDLGAIAVADEYLSSERGREHVISILETALRATGEQQRAAAAHGYFSGCGLGRFDPDMVDLFDRTLATLTELHMRVFRWIVDSQLGMNLAERYGKPLELEALSLAIGTPAAVTQKIADDLVRAGVVFDCGINSLGGYWGVHHFALSSFGRAFALYIEDARTFQGAVPPPFESPMPRSQK